MSPKPPLKIYYSASIKGENVDPELGYKVVTHLKQRGHDVLSEHVGARNSDEMNALLTQRSGTDRTSLSKEAGNRFVRAIDTEWVDAADAMVVVITGASLGVGMEIERALLKPERGLNVTPITVFVSSGYAPGLSAMVSGVVSEQFAILTYETFDDIRAELDRIF